MSAESLAKTFTTADSDNPAVTDAPAPVACYSIRAAADPGLLSRVLETFAKRGLVPDRWHSDLVGQERDELSIDLQVTGLDAHTSGFLAARLRQIWGVEAVLTSEKSTA